MFADAVNNIIIVIIGFWCCVAMYFSFKNMLPIWKVIFGFEPKNDDFPKNSDNC